MSVPELFQFRFSHYNEKARWALDYKGVAHVRHSLLPGPHMRPIRRLTGQTTVPVLRDAGEVVAGSAPIIEHLERRAPEPPLYPRDPAARARALDLQRQFDDEVGPAIRRAFFFELLPDTSYAARLFTSGFGGMHPLLYRAVFPGIRIVMRRTMRIDAEGARLGVERTARALDLVAGEAGADGYLAGNRFSVADLAAAALLAPAVMPPECPVAIPEPRSPRLERWLARWSAHPGAQWVRSIYSRHRGDSAEVPPAR